MNIEYFPEEFMIYEFQCPKGHVTEAMVAMGTELHTCEYCGAAAARILSATRTTFVFADTGKRIRHVKQSAAKVREINHRG